MQVPITIIIPNYNGLDLLRKNLPSIMAAMDSYRDVAYLIIVDDGSTDASVDMLTEEFPRARLVIHKTNKGFAEAIHSGVTAAETELLFLVNSDVMVQKDIFQALVPYFQDPKTFSVNPLIYDERGGIKRHSWNLRQFKSGGIKLMPWELTDAINWRKKGEKLPTMYAHGGSFMVRKSMFQALNGFDSIYKPFYGEDSDLGMRAWGKGWLSYFVPDVHIVHQSIGAIRSNIKFDYVKSIRRRNRYVLEWTHLSPSQLLFKSMPATILQLLGELILFDRVNLKGFYLALKKIPTILDRRKTLKKQHYLQLKTMFKKMQQYC